jgi:hypothetical protein
MKFLFIFLTSMTLVNIANAGTNHLRPSTLQIEQNDVTLVRNSKRDRRHHNPYYYRPGRPVPYLSNPYYNPYPQQIICYSQSYDGRLYWGAGLSVYEAGYNAGSICTNSTGYVCYAAGCRYAY